MIYLGIIVLIVGIIIGCWIVFMEKKDYNRIPKKIWTYWDDGDKVPKTVKMCMEGWKKYNPNYEITLLTKKNYKGYTTIPEWLASHPNFNDSPSRFSDLLKCYVLAENGGVWIDSTIILKAPLDDWLFPKYGEFSGFYIDLFTTDKRFPVIETWFFACNKNSKFMKLWRDEFSEIGTYQNIEKYIESRKKIVDFQKINDPNYLAIYISCQKVLQLDEYPMEGILLKKAEDGPFRYLVDTKWDSEKALELACRNKSYQGSIMKLRGDERNVLEKKINNELTVEKCEWL
jgi:Capsular polysaccharide synthesis protein